MITNYDRKTVADFGREWNRFDQSKLDAAELQEEFDSYFSLFPWRQLPQTAVGFDMGCGSGRWAKLAAQRVGKLYCVDASSAALEVAKENLKTQSNCEFVLASVDDLPFDDGSMDFCYSLGVMHHIPDTKGGIEACTKKLKPNAPFLLYIYYAFDNRPVWFRWIWRMTDIARRCISKLPFSLKYIVTQLIAVTVYYPLARLAFILEKLGSNVEDFPLSAYRHLSFYTMRTDALDRFGTRLEKRFTATQIREMMEETGLKDVRFRDSGPYWCAIGFRSDT